MRRWKRSQSWGVTLVFLVEVALFPGNHLHRSELDDLVAGDDADVFALFHPFQD